MRLALSTMINIIISGMLALGTLSLSISPLNAMQISTPASPVWSQLRVDGLDANTNVYAVECVDNRMLLGTQNQGLFFFDDAEKRWQKSISYSTAYVRDIWIDPLRPHRALAATFGQGLLESINYGESWQAIGADLTTPYLYALASSPSYLFVATANKGVWRSTDGGTTWETAGNLGDEGAVSLAVSSSVVCAGSVSDGLFCSEDNGDTWEQRGHSAYIVRAVAVDPSNPDFMVVSVMGKGLLQSNNAGSEWTPLPSPKEGATVFALQLDRNGSDAFLIAGVEGGGIHRRSFDDSATWTQWLTGTVSVYAITPCEEEYLAGATGGVWKTFIPDSWLHLPIVHK